MCDNDNELFIEYKTNKSHKARDKIIEKYMYLVEIISKKYANRGIDFEDLYQIACVGLINAVERFNPDIGVKFSTFATPTIMGEIKRYFRDKGTIIKLPRKIYEIFQKANRIRLKKMQYEGYIPTIDEIAKVLKLEKNDINHCMLYENVVNVLSLDSPIYSENTPVLSQVIGVEQNDFLVIENRDFLKSAIKVLTNEEKKLIIHRYYRNLTQREISLKWNVSQMYVSRLERKTLEKIKNLYFK